MDKFREAQEQFEAKEFEILGLQSTNENKGLKPRPKTPINNQVHRDIAMQSTRQKRASMATRHGNEWL